MKKELQKPLLTAALFIACLTTNAQNLLKTGGTSTFFDLNGKLGIGTTVPAAKLQIKEGTLGFTSQPLLSLETYLNLNTFLGKINCMYTLNGKNYAIYEESPDGSSIINYFKDPIEVKGTLFYGQDNESASGILCSRDISSFKFKMSMGSGPIKIPLTVNSNKVLIEELLETSTFKMTSGAGINKVLVSDAVGNATWTDPSSYNFWSVCGPGNAYIYTSYPRVGIGTNSPSKSLEIMHTDPTGGIVLNQNSKEYYKSEIQYRLKGNEEWATGSSTDDIGRKFFYIWSEVQQKTAFWIDGSNGMTGIGTEWPRAMLDVNGNLKATSIGIGIDPPTGPNYKLWVEGGIAAREVKVTINNFPDYVFEPNYNLMSIKDLENFVSNEKHLPGIPSAKEVISDDGIEIGKMQGKLLEKVEEQSLYIISLQKQIIELSKAIEELKK